MRAIRSRVLGATTVLTALVAATVPSAAGGGVITTVAGGGAGDGGDARGAVFSVASAVTADRDGGLLVGDARLVRRVDAAGVISRFAGSDGRERGDGGVATSAVLVHAAGIAQDDAGNVYIADATDRRVRKVTPGGLITTIAGSGSCGSTIEGSLATSAPLCEPHDVAVDAHGAVYIADATAHVVRRVDGEGRIWTVAGNGYTPCLVSVDCTAAPPTVLDGAPARLAFLWRPTGVALDAAGNVYIAEANNHRIRKVDDLGMISTVAGAGRRGFAGDGGPATEARLYSPRDVEVGPDGTLYISDATNFRVRAVAPDGIIRTIAGTGISVPRADGVAATDSAVSPDELALAPDGRLYVADQDRIRVIGPDGIITTAAGGGNRFFFGDGGPAREARLYRPAGVDVGSDGTLYIADRDNMRVRAVDTIGVITTIAGGGTDPVPSGRAQATSVALPPVEDVAVGPAGNVLILAASQVLEVDPAGTLSRLAGTGAPGFSGDGGPAASATLNRPLGLAVAASGHVYIADSRNNRVRVIDPNGTIDTVAGTGAGRFCGDGGAATAACLNQPHDLALDSSGTLFIADAGNQRIRAVDADGTIRTVAGDGTAGFSGDGGDARAAALNGPVGVETDGAGRVFISDLNNGRIRMVGLDGRITTVAGGDCLCIGDGGPALGAGGLGGRTAFGAAGDLYAIAVESRIRLIEGPVA